MVKFPPSAVAATRRLLLDGTERSFDAQLEAEAKTIADLSGGDESVAAVEAFLARSARR
jgi:enoyl-CoA hydratase/carnithine racemase